VELGFDVGSNEGSLDGLYAGSTVGVVTDIVGMELGFDVGSNEGSLDGL